MISTPSYSLTLRIPPTICKWRMQMSLLFQYAMAPARLLFTAPIAAFYYITAHCPLIQSNTTQCRRISFGGDARWHHLTTGPNIPNHRHTKIWIVEADADVGHVGLCEINEGFNYLPLDGVHPPPPPPPPP